MRITTWNVNGLRAALRKGVDRHLELLSPDVLMLQEVRATTAQLPWNGCGPPGWTCDWHPAVKLGYSGVATWAREAQVRLGVGIDGAPDDQGRVLRTRVGDVELLNIYVPSGTTGAVAQARKELWLAQFMPFAEQIATASHPVVMGGDMNIAHTERDIHDPRGNKKNTGFLPHERAWLSELLERGWVDLVRLHFGPIQGPYSWWSNRGRARELDRGWRIDYLLGNAAAAARLRSASIHRPGGLEISDHAPVTIDLGPSPEAAPEPSRAGDP